MEYRQLIIARKDLGMSNGKLAAQCSHAAMAFLTNKIRSVAEYRDRTENPYYEAKLFFDRDLFEKWIDGSFTKTVCQARNRNQLLKAVTMAEKLGL